MSSNNVTGIVRNTFLSFSIIGASVSNIYLIVIIGLSRTLRRRSVYKFVINSAATNLLDVVNLCIILKWSLENPSDDKSSSSLCHFNNFLINWVDDVQVLNLLFLAVERACAVYSYRSHRRRFRIWTCVAIIALTWLLTFTVNIFIAVNIIKSQYSNTRFACVITSVKSDDSKTLVYPIVTICAFYLLPLLTTIILYIWILRAAIKSDDDDDRGPSDRLSTRELEMSKMTASVFLGWLILVGAYSIKVFIDFVKTAEGESMDTGTVDWMDTVDTVVFWLRHFYINCLPLLCIIWRRDIRRKTHRLIFAKRRRDATTEKTAQQALNSIGTPRRATGGKSNHGADLNDDMNLSKRNPETGEEDDLSLDSEDEDEEDDELPPEALRPSPPANIPVLFATRDGLHVQTDSAFDSRGMESVTTARVIKCDVNNSVADLQSNDLTYEQDEEERTSDYASNRGSDAFQVSNPISVRSIEPPEAEKTGESPKREAAETRRKKRSRGVEPVERQEGAAEHGAAVAKPRRKKHKRSSSSSDVAPAPLYSSQVSRDSLSSWVDGNAPNSTEQRRHRRKKSDQRNNNNNIDDDVAPLPKLPPRRLEPLEVRLEPEEEPQPRDGSVPNIEEKPRKKKRKKKKKSSTDPLPLPQDAAPEV